MEYNSASTMVGAVFLSALLGGLFSGAGASAASSIDLQTSIFVSICGDGEVQPEEEVCDDGVNVGGYGASIAGRKCEPGCLAFGPYCGDSILQVRFSEECDDGNNASGDLCSASCLEEEPIPPGGSGQRGSIPAESGQTGVIPSATETRIVIRGKAYPNTNVNVLLDGEIFETVQADSNADFLFSTANITPGKSTFGFWAYDARGVRSLTLAATFDILQSAVTTVSGVLLPPTIAVNDTGSESEFLEISGQSVPDATIITEITGGDELVFEAEAESAGTWAFQLDRRSLLGGISYSAKSFFKKTEKGDLVESGFGKSVSFSTSDEGGITRFGDINGDDRVNLADFSILLFNWRSSVNAASDLNGDGTVNLADFSILLFNWTG